MKIKLILVSVVVLCGLLLAGNTQAKNSITSKNIQEVEVLLTSYGVEKSSINKIVIILKKEQNIEKVEKKVKPSKRSKCSHSGGLMGCRTTSA